MPFPLAPPSASSTVLVTDTCEQSCKLLDLEDVHCLNDGIFLNGNVLLKAGCINTLQRDLLTDLQLHKLYYHADMILNINPYESINSSSSCRVEWMKKTKSGKVEQGEGVLKRGSDGVLLYTSMDKILPSNANNNQSQPSSTFNLYANKRQSEQRASVILPHYKAQQLDIVEMKCANTGEPGFDSDDPDADLEF